MELRDLNVELQNNAYPGRGIVLGRTPDGKKAAVAYFIMGRSENSRNRIFSVTEDGIKTEAFDPAKVKDPSLIIYNPVRVLNGVTIVTNGDQTDTVYDFMKDGKTFEEALATREFEPDAPNYTPRISGIVMADGSYKLSILKSANGNPASCQRFFYNYSQPLNGEGHFLHTYLGNGNPIPSFEGDPEPVKIPDSFETFANGIWGSLNPDNKVSLYVSFIDLATGAAETKIFNKNQ
ncbi:MAG: IMP cyclohydrolase [Bacillota bacterium]|nr:IMP cyclohydrolase [Bacillota bacterium]